MAKPYSELPFIDVSTLDGAYWTGNLGAVIAQQAMEHGPVFRWKSSSGPDVGETRVTMVGPEANRFVMNTHRQHFSHDLGWTPFISDMFGKGLLNMDDPEHAVHRKMWNPAFAGSIMGTYLPVMQQVIEQRTSRWPERGEVDMYTESREITFDIAAAALAGFEPGPEVDRLRELFYALLHGFDAFDGDTTEEDYARVYAGFYSMRDQLVVRLIGMIHQRRNAPVEDRPRDVLSMIVHARDDEGNSLDDAQVLGHLAILLLAGHETTTTLGAWTLYNLATMPDHRARIEAELNAVRDPDGSVPFESLRTLKALDNFIRETGRLYPPVLNVPRGISSEVEFNGYTLPAGTQVRLSIAGTHYMPNVFEHPERFDPDRFAPPREEDRKTPYSLVTFGGGPRVCIGQHFANIEVKALVAHVLHRYNLELVPGQHPHHVGFLNASIPGGIRMQVTPR
jgi:retinoid hydroxylase